MDGYPRTLAQAASFDAGAAAAVPRASTRVIFLMVDDEEIVRRLSGRWSCPKLQGDLSHRQQSAEAGRASATSDGTALVQREDDKEETVRERLRRLPPEHRGADPLLPVARACSARCRAKADIEEIYAQHRYRS